jgi:hypothetical protein
MRTAASFYSCLTAAVLFVLSSAAIAAAQCSGDESLGDNVCFGTGALGSYSSDTGGNSAFGYDALYNNTGGPNTAIGDSALLQNTLGSENTAIGWSALGENTTGEGNTAIGVSALDYNKSGSNNIGIGAGGGLSLTGSNNIDIGNYGIAAESGTIRIGNQAASLQTATYIAGIYEEKVGKKHCSVLVDSDGRLGCGSSKEVDASILLNELQKQAAQLADMKASMRRQATELKASHERELAVRTVLEERLSKLERVMASKNGSRNLAAALNR